MWPRRNAAAGWLAFLAAPLAMHDAIAAVTTVNVSNVSQLMNVVDSANSAGGDYIIMLADGTYTIPSKLHIIAPNVSITSNSGVRENVIIEGEAMSGNASVGDLILVSASNFQLSNVTLQRGGWHILQIAGEDNSRNSLVHDVVSETDIGSCSR